MCASSEEVKAKTSIRHASWRTLMRFGLWMIVALATLWPVSGNAQTGTVRVSVRVGGTSAPLPDVQLYVALANPSELQQLIFTRDTDRDLLDFLAFAAEKRSTDP